MRTRRAVLMETLQKNSEPRMTEHAQKSNGAPTVMESTVHKHCAPRKTACGNFWCQCSRIMANLDRSETPYFFVTNLDKRCGPKIPDRFVQEYGDEANGNVMLDTARTAGQHLAVEFVKDEDAETGELTSIRIGEGWESFMIRNKLQAEDLLFFTLQGQSRFIVMMIRGHSRKAKEQAEPAAQKGKGEGKGKRKGKLSGSAVDDLEEGATELGRAAQKHKPGPARPNLVESSGQGNAIHSSWLVPA